MLAALVALPLLVAQPASKIEVPFRIGEDAIIVDAKVNGKDVSLMFDTGFSGSIILSSDINVGPASGSMMLRDFVGQFEAKTVALRTLQMGAKKIDSTGMEIVQKPTEHYSMSYGTRVDGIMGLEVMSKYVTEINFEQKKFIFHPDGTDITSWRPDNERTFLARLLPMGNNSLEMAVEAANGGKMVLALDTGNSGFAVTHKDVLERVGIWPAGRKPDFMGGSMVASGPVASWEVELHDLKIYGVPVKRSVWNIIDLPASSAEGDGTIGYQFLKNFNIVFDLERRRVWMANFTGEFGNAPEGDVGISAFWDARVDRMRIWRVMPASPADKAGIKPGDDLLGIDGVEITNIGFRKLSDMLVGEQGSKVSLAVSRAGQLMRFELTREYLVNDVQATPGG